MTSARPTASARFVRPLVALVFGPPVTGALGLALLRPEDASWAFAASVLGLAALVGLVAWRSGPSLAGMLVAVATAALLLLWPEVLLRWSGVRPEPAAVVQFSYPRPENMIELDADPELFWRLPSSLEDVNSAGFPNAEFVIPKPDGTWRMVFFGDSCTYQGFPAAVAEELGRSDGARHFDAVNLGVPGYTSHQGRVVAERWAAKLEPDVGIVYFGWNDHWLAYGSVDSAKDLTPTLLSRLQEHSRWVSWLLSLRPAMPTEPLAVPRVSLEEYAGNIEAIGEWIEAAGGRALLVTAPSAHIRRGAPQYLVRQGFIADARKTVELHRQYNDVVRSVAKRRDWRLLDLQARVQQHPRHNSLFRPDGIHFTDDGLAWIGGEIGREINAVWLR